MNEAMTAVELMAKVRAMLAGVNREDQIDKNAPIISIERLQGDGSCRRFYRLCRETAPSLILVAPEQTGSEQLREARAAWYIGRHLQSLGAPVPRLHGFDPKLGLLLCEDLGDRHLQREALATDFTDPKHVRRLRDLYQGALKGLALMQCRGPNGFVTDWCRETAHYDRQLMLTRESGYFLHSCWQDLLHQKVPPGLESEFEALAAAAAQAPAGYFLYRDFQSRNIMVKDAEVRFIDYQGAMLGPLGYDLASLLRDPYAALPAWFQDELSAYYLHCLEEHIAVDRARFHRFYQALALQRNLQIIGAFCFLSAGGKDFFQPYIRPALHLLRQLLSAAGELPLPILLRCVEQALELLPSGY